MSNYIYVGWTFVQAIDSYKEDGEQELHYCYRYTIEYGFFRNNANQWKVVEVCTLRRNRLSNYSYGGTDVPDKNAIHIAHEITPDQMLRRHLDSANGQVPPFVFPKQIHNLGVAPCTIEEFITASWLDFENWANQPETLNSKPR